MPENSVIIVGDGFPFKANMKPNSETNIIDTERIFN